MKQFVEFRDLEKLSATSATSFLDEIKKELSPENREQIIEKFRLSGVCVDIYGSKKYKKTFNDAIAIINSGECNLIKSLQKLVQNVDYLDLLFQDFNQLRDQTGVNSIQAANQVPAFLIASEIFLASLQDYSKGIDVHKLESKYPFILTFGNEDGVIAPPERVLQDIIHINEQVMEQVGTVLKYLYFLGIPFSGIDAEITLSELKISRQHFDLLSRYEALFHIYDLWRFWGGNFIEKNHSKIMFEYKNEDDAYSQRIAVLRTRIMRNRWMQDFSLIKDKVPVEPNTNTLPPEGYRTEDEKLSEIFCNELFGSVELKECISGISLAEWIRSYTILKQISVDFLTKRVNSKLFTLQAWCIVKTKDEWVETFTGNGFDQNKAKMLVEMLIFSNKALDLIDCPFIPLDNYLVIIPSLVIFISPADAMLSNFYNKELLIGFRGKRFETKIIKLLSKNGIIGKNIKTKDGSAEYECDVVFTLDKDLFFVECKTFLQPETPRRYYEFFGKITEAASQLNRISSFYETNINIVRSNLELSCEWKAEAIYKIIVSSAFVGEPFFIDGCYITDYSNLQRFFDRQAPGVSIGKLRISWPDLNYKGKITTKLINIISDPPPINIAKLMMKRNENNMKLDKYAVLYSNFNEIEMFIPNNKFLRHLAKQLNISLESLKKKIDGN
jgi:hypothetical protein